MTKNKTLLTIALASLMGLAGCSVRGNSSVAGTSTPASSVSSAVDIQDPYAAVLAGIDLTKATNDTTEGAIANGYAEENVAYGWVSYTAYGSGYGVAVKLTFADQKITDIAIGAPASNVHNFTPSYATGNGAAAYATYKANFLTNVKAAVKTKDPIIVANALKDAVADPTKGEYGTFTPVDDYKFVGTGASQTDSRTNVAIYQACKAYVIANEASYDPFTTVFSAITVDTDTIPSTGVVNGNGFKDTADNKIAYGYTIYTNQYKSNYAAAVKITTDSASKITAVELGLPLAGAHNFTPMYLAKAGFNAFIDYSLNIQKVVNTTFVGKTVDQAVTAIGTPAIDLTSQYGTFTPSVDFVVTTGATQTDARTGLAIFAALNALKAA